MENVEEVDGRMKDTYDAIASEIASLWEKSQSEGKKQILVGFAGPPGAGKSTLVHAVCKRLPGSICLPMDGYHYTQAVLKTSYDSAEEFRRRGSYWTFDALSFVNDLKNLRTNHHGSFPSFDHAVGDPIPNDIQVSEDNHIVLVEGNYLLLYIHPWVQIKSLLDYTYFIDCETSVLGKRVRSRHMSVGLNAEDANVRYESNDALNAALIMRTRNRADKVIKSL